MSRSVAWAGLLPILVTLLAHSARADVLNYTKNYFVTGDYAVAGVGLRGTGSGGFAPGTINMSGVPAGADIVAAFLYWETEETTPAPSLAHGFFDGKAIVGDVRGNPNNPVCWSSGGTGGSSKATGRVYRADVLRYLAIDSTNNVRIANGPHTVKLPDSGGNGNGNIFYTNGASLLVVYRVLATGAAPLRAVVIYDGAFTLSKSSPAMTQVMAGFYEAAATPAARMTHIVGNGQPGFASSLKFNGANFATNAFVGTAGTRWDNPSYNITLSSGAASFQIDATTTDNQACMTWSAIVTSTNIADFDGDGLLDTWELNGLHLNEGTATQPATFGGCSSYPAEPCVNLPAMGASRTQKDIFMEIDWLQGTDGHLHIPKLAALNSLGARFALHGIKLHFDVGNYGGYSTGGSPYIIPYNPAVARAGGEVVSESSLGCPNAKTNVCAFPNRPYAVLGWKIGFRAVKEGFPALNLLPHFAHNRKDIFHYVLFSHALAGPFDALGHGIGTDPWSVSGVADRPGGDLMVSLGLWRADNPLGCNPTVDCNDQTGSDLVQAGTLMHELGHNLGLSHAGANRTPNCEPNYQSVMNYMYQTRGLTDVNGFAQVDFSPGTLPSLFENNLLAFLPGILPYRLRFFGPPNALDISLNRTTKRQCSDGKVAQNEEMRLESTISSIDWSNGTTPTKTSFDVNFDGSTASTAFFDFNDWGYLNLQQIGARANVSGLSSDVGQEDLGQEDLGQEDLGQEDLGQEDLGQEDLGQEDLGQEDLGQTDKGDVDYDTAISTLDATSSSQPLTATSSLTAITLNWGAPGLGQIRQYKVFRTADPAGVFAIPPELRGTVTGPPPATTFTDTVDGVNTLYNTKYTYFIQAVDINGTNSGPSTTASGIVKHLFIKANNKSRAYGAPDPAFDYTTTGLDPGVLTGTTVCTTTATAASIPGDYPINCSGLTPTAGVTYTPGTLTITRAPVTASITAANKTYDTTNVATVTGCSLTGVLAGDVGSVACTGTGATFVSADAGTWTVTANISLGGAKAVYYMLTSPTATTSATINKATPVVTGTGGRFFYDGLPHPAIGSVLGVGGAVIGTPAFTYTPGGAAAPIEIGSYSAVGSFPGNNNYNPALSAAVVIKIDGFKITGSMATARSYHSATLLLNGKVLIAGGLNSSGGTIASAEVYDPSTGTFSSTANNMPNKAAGHTATLLTNGKVLVAGGGNSSTQLYDPATNSWSSAGGMSGQRSYHTATRLADGRVLIAGGSANNGSATNSAQLYDPATGNFTATGSMTVTREFHTATLLADGKVLIAGGRAASGSIYLYRSSAEVYDPATGVFTAVSGSMTAAWYGHVAAMVASGPNAGKILIAGGANSVALSDSELFDPIAGTFTATGPMASARQYFTATVISTGVLIAGGLNSTGALGTAEQYQATSFIPSGTLRFARAAHSATLLNNGSVLVVGGQGAAGSPISSAELFVITP